MFKKISSATHNEMNRPIDAGNENGTLRQGSGCFFFFLPPGLNSRLPPARLPARPSARAFARPSRSACPSVPQRSSAPQRIPARSSVFQRAPARSSASARPSSFPPARRPWCISRACHGSCPSRVVSARGFMLGSASGVLPLLVSKRVLARVEW